MKNVIIIGAGPAGLTAGYELLKDKNNEYKVIILEETNQIGGISRTVKYNGNRMDIGGHRFFSKDESVMKFWEDLMPLQGENSFDDEKLGRTKSLKEGGPSPDKEDRVMLTRTRVSRIYYLKKFFDYPVTMKKDTFMNMGFIRTMNAGFSYLKTLFIKKKEDSLENFYINKGNCKLFIKYSDIGYTEEEKDNFYQLFGSICDEIFVETISASLWQDTDTGNKVANQHKGIYGQELKKKQVCPFLFTTMVINEKGIAHLCCVDWKTEYTLGDLKKDSITSIWNGNKLREYQLLHLYKKKDSISLCRNCEVNKSHL